MIALSPNSLEEDFGRRLRDHAFGGRGGAVEHVFDSIRGHLVIDADFQAHRVPAFSTVKVDQRLPDELLVGQVDLHGIVRDEASRTPVDFYRLHVPAIDQQPVADGKGPAKLQTRSRR